MRREPLTEIGAAIQELLHEVFGLLHSGATRVVSIYEQAGQGGAVLPGDLHALRPAIRATLERVPSFQGTGFVADPVGLRGAARYEEWWHRGPDGQLRFLDLDLDPDSTNTYNYVDMPYFVGAKRGVDTVAGPYLDFAGSGLHVLTFAVPVIVGGAFVGVSAADVAVGDFEKLVARHLLRADAPVLLTNADDRVVASSSAGFAPGDRTAALPTNAPRVGGPGVDWRVGYAPAVSGANG